MKRKYSLIIILVFVFFFSSCELMVQQEPEGVIRIVSVGIDYADIAAVSPNLNSTCNDAYQVGQVLKALGEKEGTEVELYYLLSEHDGQTIMDEFNGFQNNTSIYYPSKNNFSIILNYIQSKQKSQDRLFIFFAGHGIEVSGINEFELIYGDDLSDSYSFVMPLNKGQTDIGISKYLYDLSEYLDLVETIPGKKVLLNDFCYSGALVSDDYISLDLTTYFYANHPSTADLLFSSSSEKVLDDIYILAAAQSYQESFEDYQHGNFTRALLDGLGWDETNQVLTTIPASSIFLNSEKIYLSKLANYTKKNDKNGRQTPRMTTSSNDIVLFDF